MSGQQTTIKDPDNMSAAPKQFSFDYSYWSHDGYQEEKDGYLSPKDSKYDDQVRIIIKHLSFDPCKWLNEQIFVPYQKYAEVCRSKMFVILSIHCLHHYVTGPLQNIVLTMGCLKDS